MYFHDVSIDNATTFRFELFDDENEPIDAIYQFTRESQLGKHWEQLVTSILPPSCKQVLCRRQVPMLWSKAIVREDGEAIGRAHIFKDQEPIDAIDNFCQANDLNKGYRVNILRVACQELECTRTLPVVDHQQVNGEDGV